MVRISVPQINGLRPKIKYYPRNLRFVLAFIRVFRPETRLYTQAWEAQAVFGRAQAVF